MVELVGRTASLDALARLHLQRGEPALAADWLEQRLQTASPSERVAVLLGLARARIQAEQPAEAITALETAFEEAPRNAKVRKLLIGLHRSRENWQALADRLSTAVEHVTDESRILAYAREAAAIYQERLDTPDRSVPPLRKAVELVPEDRKLRSMLAEGLRAAGEVDEAAELLGELIESFGRRRSAERASYHLQLARVKQAENNAEEAIDQLETASRMDAGNTAILQALAELARDDGQLDRAERAYRTLLLTVRRQGETEAGPPIAASEILLELSRIAANRGQQEKADELMESVLGAVAQDDDEAAKIQARLHELGEVADLDRVLVARLGRMQSPHRRADILAQRAELLEGALDRPDEALETRLEAIRCAPGSPVHHQAAWDRAEEQNGLGRYVTEVESLLADARETDLHVRAELMLRLGQARERLDGDLDSASEWYAQAEQTGVRQADVWRAQARIAGARGDDPEQLRLLNQLATLGEDEVETRADAQYRVAEVQLAARETLDEGAQSLREGLRADARIERAASILRQAADAFGDHEGLIDLYEQVARQSEEPQILLHYLERRAALAGASVEVTREGAELATALDEPDRAEAFMLRAAELGKDSPAEVDWALLGLARRRRDAADIAGAVKWLGEASEVAEPAELFAVGREVAELASGPDGDLTLAAKLYERLRERDPTAREAWEPLGAIYAKLGDVERLERVVDETLDGLEEPADRTQLRVLLAQALLGTEGRDDEAIEVLQGVLTEQPSHDEAQRLLAEHLERSGRADELGELLAEQLQSALERGDAAAAKNTALRLGRMRAEADPGEALAAYRAALELGDDADLLGAMLERMDPEAEPHERAALLERLLSLAEGEQAAGLALELSELYASLDDDAGSLRALTMGNRQAPDDARLLERLEERYRDAGDYEGLTRTLIEAAQQQQSPKGKVTLLREAAALFRDRLSDAAAAVRQLEQACELAPEDVGLRAEYARALAAAGHQSTALQMLGEALESAEDDDIRLDLLLTRARLQAQVQDDAGAIDDLEWALAIDAERAAPDLEAALDRVRAGAASAGDLAEERVATLRCVDLMLLQNDRERASALLTSWVERVDDDVAALQQLREIDTEDERWDAVVTTCERLVELENGSAQVEAALALALACRALDNEERARSGLEMASTAQPDSVELRAELGRLYRRIGARRELAAMLLSDAQDMDDDAERAAALHQAGSLLVELDEIDQAAAAIPVLGEALELNPGHAPTIVALADAYILVGQFDDANELLDEAIEVAGGRRAASASMLLHRKAEVARAQGDMDARLDLLQEAHACSKRNGVVAAELADLAEELNLWDLASKTLRTISLIDSGCPISRGEAFLRQAKIALHQDDRKAALMWARRARREDPESEEARALLEQLGRSSSPPRQ